MAIKRADFEGERYEMTEFQRRVQDNYELLRDETWVSVCAEKSLEEVQEELYSLVIRELDRDKGALGQLWVSDQAEQMEAEVISTASSSHQSSSTGWRALSWPRLTSRGCDPAAGQCERYSYSYGTYHTANLEPGLGELDSGPLPHDDQQRQEQRGQQVSCSLYKSVSMHTLS